MTDVPCFGSVAPLLLTLAMYHGEEWLESNCWYMEQPIPTGPPPPPFAGAKWKKELCFKGAYQSMRIYVLDTSSSARSLWMEKYSIRSTLAKRTGNPGNSCIHLTDDQSGFNLTNPSLTSSIGHNCDGSYACICARALLEPSSVAFINSEEVRA